MNRRSLLNIIGCLFAIGCFIGYFAIQYSVETREGAEVPGTSEEGTDLLRGPFHAVGRARQDCR